MDDVQVTTHGSFHVATGRGVSGEFTAWAKMGKIQSDCPVKEPGEHIWFNFGRTRDEARGKVLAELGLASCGGSATTGA